MTSNTNHVRHHAKKNHAPYARIGRPGLIQRTSCNNKYHHKVSQASTKTTPPLLKKEEDDSDIMAASFLQFCPICEKQIISPSNSFLYCSESCRKKDKSLPFTTSFNPDQTPPVSPFSGTFMFEDLPMRDIIPQRSPTSRRPLSIAFSETSEEDGQSTHERALPDSEAARYLRQFQSSTTAPTLRTSSRTSKPKRLYASSTAISSMPSLASTPTSSASNSVPATPLTTAQRPLPPRTNPYSTSWGVRGIDLVMPAYPSPSTPPTPPASLSNNSRFSTTPFHSASTMLLKSPAVTKPSTDVAVADGVLSYEKQWPLPSLEREKAAPAGSLKQLFRSGEMQATPKRPVWGSTGDLQGLLR